MILKPTLHLWTLVAAGVLSIGLPAMAGTIATVTVTSFTATPEAGAYFGQTINTANDGTGVRITNTTITCSQQTPCNSSIDLLITGTGLTDLNQVTIGMDGSLSGSTNAAGLLVLTAQTMVGQTPTTFFGGSVPFAIPFGSFNVPIVPAQSLTLPLGSDGSFTASGSLSLVLAPGQTLTLPSSFSISFASPSDVPEPGTMSITALGLIAAFGAFKRRRS